MKRIGHKERKETQKGEGHARHGTHGDIWKSQGRDRGEWRIRLCESRHTVGRCSLSCFSPFVCFRLFRLSHCSIQVDSAGSCRRAVLDWGRPSPIHGARGATRPTCHERGRFMESEHLRTSDVSWGHETSSARARNPGFSRLDAGPPEGGTPYQGRFMQSTELWRTQRLGLPSFSVSSEPLC